MNVQQAITAAADAVGAVGKYQKMQAGPAKYNYRGLDDLVDAVHPALVAAGVTFSPVNVEMLQQMERTTKSGSIQYHLRALVTYAVYGPEGDSIHATVLAEGTDTGDKAGNKLMSGAYKYALSQVLSIPFAMEDQDADLSEEVAPQQQQYTPEESIAVIQGAADKLGKTLDEITTKYRESHGGIGVDELLMTSEADLAAFANQITAYMSGK